MFKLKKRLDDGTTLYDHAMSVVRQTKKWPADIPEPPPFPEALQYLWQWFLDLSAGRSSSGFGINPMGHGDVLAWSQLTGVALSRWELSVLRELDSEFLRANMSTKQGEAKGKKP